MQGEGEAATVTTGTYERIGTRADGQRLVTEARTASAPVPLRAFLDGVRQRLAARQESPQ